jgi:uncharacterized protein YceH (UPF0502 family)
MSGGLVDVKRLRITQDTDAWLEAEHRRTGKKKVEILRETLDALAKREISAANLLVALARSKGNRED